MEKHMVDVVLAYSEIKGVCQAIMRSPDETCEPGEKMLAEHILVNIIERIEKEE